MEDLLEDIQIVHTASVDFRRDVTTIMEDEIAKLRKLEVSGEGQGEHRGEVKASVSSNVQVIFQEDIEGKIRAGCPNDDIGYCLQQFACTHGQGQDP